MQPSTGEKNKNPIVRALSWHFGNTEYTGHIPPYDKHSKFNPWFLMPAAVIVQFCCGSLYAWSLFNAPIDEAITGDAKSSQAPITFFIAVGVLGLSAAAMGPWIERNGPKKSLIVSSSLFYIGNLLSALAIYLKWMWLLYIGYGVIGGFAIGINYVAPVSTLQKWFPHRRGLAAGFGVCGFGSGSIVMGKVTLPLIESIGLPLTFVVLGSCYFIAMISNAFLFRLPPPDYSPFSPEELKKQEAITIQRGVKSSAKDSILSLDYWLVYIMLLCNILFGLVVISRLSDMITQLFSRDPDEAATMVSINGVLNLFGRLFFSAISDKIGRKTCYLIMMISQILIVATFPLYTEQKAYGAFIFCMFVLTACFGGAFGVIPAILADMFGSSNVAVCFGLILTAWSLSGVVGGLVFTAIYNNMIQSLGWSTEDSYPYTVNTYWVLVFCVAGLLATVIVRTTIKDIKLPPVEGQWFRFRFFDKMIRIKRVACFPEVEVLSSEQYDDEWDKYLQSQASVHVYSIDAKVCEHKMETN